jgi:hypothetical protein
MINRRSIGRRKLPGKWPRKTDGYWGGQRWRGSLPCQKPQSLPESDDAAPARFGVPDLQCTVTACAYDPFAVGAEGHRQNSAGVPLEGEDLMAGLGVPELQRVVVASAHDSLTVGAEGHAIYPAVVPLEGARLLTSLDVPDSEDLVAAAADDPFASLTWV